MSFKACINDCKTIILPKLSDKRGHLTAIEQNDRIPFIIKRIFYNYGVEPMQSRGAHAHKTLHQFLIALNGAFNVVLDDGVDRTDVLLSAPWIGLHIPPGIWAEQNNFTANSICLVFASESYDEADYVRNYNDFLSLRSEKE